jgi:hypothetical protein
MPPKDRLRLNYLGRTAQARPETGHPYQQRPSPPHSRRRGGARLKTDAELMTEKQVLGLKPAPRLEQIGDEHSGRWYDCSQIFHRRG